MSDHPDVNERVRALDVPARQKRPRPTGITAPLLLAWALSATLASASALSGPAAVLVVASFTLFGSGIAAESLLPPGRRVADRLLLVLGAGLGSATVVSQILLVLGLYHPTVVIGVLSIVVCALMALKEVRR